MKRFGLFIVLSVFFFSQALTSELADSARMAYTNDKHAVAAELYQQMLEKQGPSAELYYNLGNCHYKMNNTGPAILNYERAARLSPSDEDIQHNLEVARNQIQDEVEAIPELFFIAWLDTFNHWLSVRTWALLSVLFFLIFIAFIAWRLFRKKAGARRALSTIAIVAFAFSAICLILANRLDKQSSKTNEAIVYEDCLVKSSPSETGINLFEIHEGLKVTVQDSLNNYTQITLANGEKGWIKSSKLKNIAIPEQ